MQSSNVQILGAALFIWLELCLASAASVQDCGACCAARQRAILPPDAALTRLLTQVLPSHPSDAGPLASAFLHHSCTSLFPRPLQKFVSRLRAGRAARVVVLRTRLEVAGGAGDASAGDYATVLAKWLRASFPASNHTVQVLHHPNATMGDLDGVLEDWIASRPNKTADSPGIDLVVLDTFDADHAYLEQMLRPKAPYLDYRDRSSAELVQLYLEAMERVVRGAAQQRGRPGLLAVEGSSATLPRNVANLILHRYKVNVLSLRTGLSGVCPRGREALQGGDGGDTWRACADVDERLSDSSEDTHLLLGWMMVHVFERERAELECDFVLHNDVAVDPPLANRLTCRHLDQSEACLASASAPAFRATAGSYLNARVSEWDAAAFASNFTRPEAWEQLSSGEGSHESGDQGQCEEAQRRQYDDVVQSLLRDALINSTYIDNNNNNRHLVNQLRGMLRRTRSPLGSQALQRVASKLKSGGTQTVRVAVFGNSFPLGHHCDDIASNHTSVKDQFRSPGSPPFRHARSSGSFLWCSYPARFTLMLEQAFPNAALEVVSLAQGGTCPGSGAKYFDEDMAAQFGDSPVDLYIVDYTSCSTTRLMKVFLANKEKMGFASFNRFYLQDMLLQYEQLLQTIRRRDGTRAATLLVMDAWDGDAGSSDLLPSFMFALLRRYANSVTPVMWASAVDYIFDTPLLRAIRDPLPWNGGHPTWRAHQVLASVLLYTLLAEQARLVCHPGEVILMENNSTGVKDAVGNATMYTTVYSDVFGTGLLQQNCTAGPGAYYDERCPLFCSSCIGEKKPMSEYDAMHKHVKMRESGHVSSFHFPAFSISPQDSWQFKPETRWNKYGWISNSVQEGGEIVFAIRYKTGEVRIEYLKTYNHIGRAEVRIEDSASLGVCNSTEERQENGPHATQAARENDKPHERKRMRSDPTLLDGYWRDKCSFPEVEVVKIDAYSGDGSYGCAMLHVQNVYSNSTKSAKFKLLSIRSY